MPTKRKYHFPEPGDRYGRLTVISVEDTRGVTGKIHHMCLCRCECGKLTKVDSHNLRTGHVSSCGCYNKKTTAERSIAGTCGATAYNKSGYKGVCHMNRWNKWKCELTYMGVAHKSFHDTPEDAAEAYDALAIELRGPDACINFPEDHPEHHNRKPARRIR